MSAPAEHRNTMSTDAYLAFEGTSSTKHEYVRGEVFAMAGTTDAHNDVVGNVSAILKAHLRGGPCRTYFVDVKLRVEAADVFYYPDVFVRCDARDLEDPLVKRHAVVVVEVLSESTAETDRDEKFADYRKLETLREYVLVDSRVRHVVSYRRKDDGTWQFVPATAEETLTIESVGLTVAVAALYEDTDVPARRARPDARG